MASTHDSLPPTSTARHLIGQHARRAGVAVLIGAAFAGGALFAGAQGGERPARVDDMLARAEARTERLEDVQGELELRYHQELVDPSGRATKPVDPSGRAASSASEPSRAPEPEAEVASRGEVEEIDPPASAPTPTVTPPAPEDPERESPQPTLDEPEPAEALSSRERLAAAFADVMGDSAPALTAEPEAAKTPAPASAPTGGFTVQVGSFPSAESASALVADYQRKGYEVRVAVATVAGRTVHRVQVGDFSTRDEAMAYRADLEAKEGILSLVVGR